MPTPTNTDVFLEAKSGPVTKDDFRATLDALGITVGDVVMVHSRLFSLGRIPAGLTKEAFTDNFIDTLLDAVGPTGTLIFPTFTLAVCKSGFFDVDKTAGEMGALSERARQRQDSIRTNHPIFSVAVMGARIPTFMSASVTSCFGEDTVFDRLHNMNATGADKGKVKFLTIGIETPPEAVTYIHAIEEKMKVPYRYHKMFPCRVQAGDEKVALDVEFFVRDLVRNVVFHKKACWDILKGNPGIRTTKFGDSTLTALHEDKVFDYVTTAIAKQDNFLCLEE